MRRRPHYKQRRRGVTRAAFALSASIVLRILPASIPFVLIVAATPAFASTTDASGASTIGAVPPVRPIVFVPLDDRPVTLQLPQLLGEIAGVPVVTPPRSLLGSYLIPGSPDAIIGWLNGRSVASKTPEAFVISSDMLVYGGLVASRIPGPSFADAYFRLRELRTLRRRDPGAWIAAFGTIMRLAPTGVPADTRVNGAPYFAAYPAWTYLQQYANLPDPPLPSEDATAQTLRAKLGPTLNAYLAVRARNLAVDRLLLQHARDGALDALVLGQDDAGPVGLHLRDVAQLQTIVSDDAVAPRAAIEPGADELGMALVAHALARTVNWTPHVAVTYSTPSAAAYQDPLEFAPIEHTIARLITLCGGILDDRAPDIHLAVRVPNTPLADDDAFLTQLQTQTQHADAVAFVDLSFEASYAAQGVFAQRLLETGVASRLDAYAAWNTTANSVGTALAEAIAAGAGRRAHRYDALAHRTFTFMRFADDVAFHVDVRPTLNAWLDQRGITDHTLLSPLIAAETAERNRAFLWNRAQTLLTQLYPGLHIAAMQIDLPWNRTFEAAIDVRLAPNV